MYRAVLRLPARCAIHRMLAEGLPPELAGPFAYLAWPVIAPSDRRVLVPIDRLREMLANRSDDPPHRFISPTEQPDDRNNIPAAGPLEPLTWHWVAHRTSVGLYWGAFLYLCAKHTRARTVLELGGAVGMSACYLGAGDSSRQLITVEGSSSMSAIAEPNLRAINPNARVVNAMFDDALDEWLPKLSGKLDIVHIDGQHERISTLHYFERLKPHLHPGALVILDDIHWSDDMRRAWKELCQSPGLTHAVDVGRYGICVWAGTSHAPRVHDFSRYASDWRDENRPTLES
jgi:hypothetical protein